MNLLPNEYTFLFNTLSDTEVALDRLRTELMNAQRHAEELFLERTGKEGSDTEGNRQKNP